MKAKFLYWSLIGIFAAMFICSAVKVVDYLVEAYKYKQMMEEVRALARAFGCTDLQLGVYPQNDAAVSFYQKCGFMIRSIDMQRKV